MFLQKYKQINIYLLIPLILLLTIITIEPLVHVGFTTTDDLNYYLHYTQNSISINGILSYLKSSGFKPLHFPFVSVPYIFDSFIWFKFTQIFALLLSHISLSFLVTLITKNKYIGLLTYSLISRTQVLLGDAYKKQSVHMK